MNSNEMFVSFFCVAVFFNAFRSSKCKYLVSNAWCASGDIRSVSVVTLQQKLEYAKEF